MIKCLKCEFCVTEQGKEKAVDGSVESTKNDKSDGEIREVKDGSGDMNNKGNGTDISYELEHNNKVLNEATSGSSSSDKVVKKEGKKKMKLDLETLTRSQNSRLTGPNTQPCTPLGSKKAPSRNVENSFSSPSSKYALHLHTC
jgi:hypothetical protein